MNWWKRLATMAGVIEGVTANDDFTDRWSDILAILRTRRSAWVGAQEGKRHDYADELPNRYGVVQRLITEATRGVAVIWDRWQLRAIGKTKDNPRRRGYGYQELIGPGEGIMARGVAWQDVRPRGPGGRRRPVRLAVIHDLPPRVSAARRAAYRDAFIDWCNQSPIPVWVAGDFNDKDFRPLARRVAGRRRQHHVDGHLITGRLRFRGGAKPLKRRTSDHRAVAALVRIPKRKRKAS